MSAKKLTPAAITHAERAYDRGYRAGMRDCVNRTDALDKAIRSSDPGSGPRATELMLDRAREFLAFMKRGR
jgi:hypothetical protein